MNSTDEFIREMKKLDADSEKRAEEYLGYLQENPIEDLLNEFEKDFPRNNTTKKRPKRQASPLGVWTAGFETLTFRTQYYIQRGCILMEDIEQEIAVLLDDIDINCPAIERELAELWACCEKEWPAIVMEAEKMWMTPIKNSKVTP